ncbi:hypothetical protein [Dictyobacter arantiisoli]|uniref:Uncharacterized protein n=1 Tax=Dictyobacter arantiisoli TaxID=2014874 RepID=A0A5A5TGQ2_9CHLR|nr:hypothetical protein [Dictyobacter arantiisoli]GCF10502.1 hypothetical protein KDI_40660 [Dictyobacter arantiisoli]
MKDQHTRKITLHSAHNIPERPTPFSPAHAPAEPPLRSHMGKSVLSAALNAHQEADMTSSLDIVLERVQRCLTGRITPADTTLLAICLRQIFENAEILYSILLPELTLCATQMVEEHSDQSASLLYFNLKMLLQDSEIRLERLTPLGQLLQSTILTSIESLDRSCSIYGAARIKRRLQQEGEDEERTDVLAAIEASHIPDSTYYQWMQALRLLTSRLQYWQEQNEQRLEFTLIFGSQPALQPTLQQIDTMFHLLVERLQKLFIIILPEFHNVARGDDETVVLHLLNLMQHIDLLLAHIDTLKEAIRVLIQCYEQDEAL